MAYSHKFYGISKGSKRFPFIEVPFTTPNLLPEQAMAEYDKLVAARTRTIKSMARWIAAQEGPITDLPEDFLAKKDQVDGIDIRIAELLEQFPEVA